MIIKIEQSFLSLREKYKIYVNDSHRFVVKTSFFHLPMKPDLSLYDLEGNKLFKINRVSPFFFEYDIEFQEEIISLQPVSDSKFHYSLTFHKSVYEFYGHEGRKFSVFKNEHQVAWLEKDLVGDYYKIIANNDENKLILVAFVLTYDIHFHAGNDFSIDFGKIGWKMKEFDESWKPK